MVSNILQQILARGKDKSQRSCSDHTLTDANQDEVALKRELLDHARQVNVILDASKIAKVAFSTLATVDQIDRVITSARDPAPSEEGLLVLQSLSERGIKILSV